MFRSPRQGGFCYTPTSIARWHTHPDFPPLGFQIPTLCAEVPPDRSRACRTPAGREPDAALVDAARSLHPAGADGVRVDHDADDAARDADMISTDTWVSMGQEGAMDREAVCAMFEPFRVDAARMRLGKPDAVFMHCLPAVPGEEMTADVLRGPQSIVINQAENRLWTVQTLLATRIFS